MPTVSIQLAPFSGVAGMSLRLYPKNSGALVNAGGDALTETAAGHFQATVDEALSGVYRADILQGSAVVYTGWLNTTVSMQVDDPSWVGASESYIANAFTEIKGAGWSSATDTLEQIRSNIGAGATVIVSPLSATDVQRVNGTTITRFILETSPVRVRVFDSQDAPVDLSLKTLRFTVSTLDSQTVCRLEDADILVDGIDNSYFTINPPMASIRKQGTYRWSLCDTASGDEILAEGPWLVRFTAR